MLTVTLIENIKYAAILLPILGSVGGFAYKKHQKFIKPFFAGIADIQKQLQPGNDSLRDKIDGMVGKMEVFDDHLQMLSKIFHSTLYLDPNPIFKADANGGFIFVNYAWLKLTGFTGQEEAYGVGWTKALHKEDRSTVLSEWERSIISQSQFNMEHRYVNSATKETTNVMCRTTVIRDKDGKVVQVIGLVEVMP